MHRLPDGSGFLVGTIGGARPPGLINAIKYTRDPAKARAWLLLWRNYSTARSFSREEGQGPPMSRKQSLEWALSVQFPNLAVNAMVGAGYALALAAMAQATAFALLGTDSQLRWSVAVAVALVLAAFALLLAAFALLLAAGRK